MDRGPRLGVGVSVVNASNESEIDAAYSRFARERPDGILIMDNPINYRYRQLITARAAAAHIPSIYPTGDYVDAGGFMSYGVSFADQGRRAASYVDKILKGAKPSDLPVEQATQFELIFSSKATRALGIKIPGSLLMRADRVID
ncbi:MAG: ABC transporter substrate binding protein [Burkholderiaceae bacterium]